MSGTPASKVLDRVLVLEMVRVTEAAAIAASKLIGRGDEKAADAAAVEAMRGALNELPMDGTVVIGEGERDEAPMLYIGERVGSAQGTGPGIDIALDPLEGTTITAKDGPNALAVLAIAEKGCLLNAPDTYMEKLAVGPGYAEGTIDITRSVADNIRSIAKAKGVEPSDITACVLDRDRHAGIIAELRALGCHVRLFPTATSRASSRSPIPRPESMSMSAPAERRRACSRRRHCAASAASCRAGWCSAMMTRSPERGAGESKTSSASTSSRTWPRETASSLRRA